ncbi:YibE/F family protein [Haloimpatiens massiliensis]|uniref:YibE/F family protein n=1 Tax=Haloimpatiens massiliensis TaxID=1658110 RepID=UPI000C81C323|nr:YibE/F family protein [Haloimpatiens massiliensis]
MQNSKLKISKKFLITLLSITIIFVSIHFFMENNQRFYSKTIAKITSVDEKLSKIEAINGKKENIKEQNIQAIIKNGKHKGKKIQLLNKTSFSQVNDLDLKINDEVFITTKEDSNKNLISAKIIGFKRDKYMGYITILFIFFILLIGRYKGLRSLISLSINILIFSLLIEMFLHGYNLTILSIIISILFVILSITIVCGVNKKTLASIISTLISTLITILISLLVITLNDWNGIHFESMEFLTHPPVKIFLVEILIGTLGAIMDISISVSASIKEIYDTYPDIETKKLIQSGIEIGKDMMGTMTNTLLFAYISGSIPIILLLLRNRYSISYIVNINLSLEFIRAITGSIGVVLCIPISIYISVFFIKNFRLEKLRK